MTALPDSALASPRAASGALFDGLLPQPPDVVLSLIKLFREDPRPGKIDVGVGVYKDAQGRTPVFAAMKAAERRLLETQDTKAYLGPEGDFGYLERLTPIIFGIGAAASDLFAVQTPGGTGALCVAATFVKQISSAAPTIWVSDETWANHPGIFKSAITRSKAWMGMSSLSASSSSSRSPDLRPNIPSFPNRLIRILWIVQT